MLRCSQGFGSESCLLRSVPQFIALPCPDQVVYLLFFKGLSMNRTWQSLRLELRHGVQYITINRPDVRNAFNELVIGELRDAFKLLNPQETPARTVVLSGEGKAFSAGVQSVLSPCQAVPLSQVYEPVCTLPCSIGVLTRMLCLAMCSNVSPHCATFAGITLAGAFSIFDRPLVVPCASFQGADLNWMKKMVDYSREENLRDSHRLFEMIYGIWNCPLPVIARVNGDALGGVPTAPMKPFCPSAHNYPIGLRSTKRGGLRGAHCLW